MKPVEFLIWFCCYAILILDSAHAASRQVTTLSDGWKFVTRNRTGAEKVTFDDSTWANVSVPHTWNTSTEKPLYRGPGWYRRVLDVTPASGKRYFLRFEAASLVADVFVNGQNLGQHRGGFTAFCFEITGALQTGRNQLAVLVDNFRFEDIAPISGDFTVFGGLYRLVHLIETDALCISPLSDGAPGVRVESSDISAASAKVRITTDVSDRRADRAVPASVRTTILTGDGRTVATQTTPVPREATTVTQNIQLTAPRLWNGLADPHLYTARVEITTRGAVLDAVDQSFGLRTLVFDKEKGAFLNGRPYRLLGVCRHQDHAGSDWAITEAEQDEDLAIIREMGANAVRLAHYPHSEYFHRICDRAGILVWAEVPNVNEIRDTPEFTANARQQLREMIAQLGNHPSIFAWSLWNELGLNANPTALIK
jgi:beta-galactosidase